MLKIALEIVEDKSYSITPKIGTKFLLHMSNNYRKIGKNSKNCIKNREKMKKTNEKTLPRN